MLYKEKVGHIVIHYLLLEMNCARLIITGVPKEYQDKVKLRQILPSFAKFNDITVGNGQVSLYYLSLSVAEKALEFIEDHPLLIPKRKIRAMLKLEQYNGIFSEEKLEEEVGESGELVYAESGFVEDSIQCLLLCPICLELLNAPKRTKCGHYFCGECIDVWLNNSITCPLCRELIEKATTLKESLVSQIITCLKGSICKNTICCSNEKRGCTWKGEPSQEILHLKTDCQFEVIYCENREHGCFMSNQRRMFPQNHESTCSFSITDCAHCDRWTGLKKDYLEHRKICLHKEHYSKTGTSRSSNSSKMSYLNQIRSLNNIRGKRYPFVPTISSYANPTNLFS